MSAKIQHVGATEYIGYIGRIETSGMVNNALPTLL